MYACLLVGLSVSSSHSLADANNAVSTQYIPNLISTTRRRHDLITPIFVMSIFILTTRGDDAMLTVSVSCLSVCINVTQNVVHEFRHFLDQWCFYAVQSGANNQTQRIRIETSCEGPLGASVSSLGAWSTVLPQNRFWGLIMSICCGSVQRPNESSYVNKYWTFFCFFFYRIMVNSDE